MNDAEKSYGAIVATNLELQKLLCKTVQILALDHQLSSSSDPRIALAEVLSNFTSELRSAAKPFAVEKVFMPGKRDKVISSIDICSLDSSLLLAILLKVERFLGITRNQGVCVHSHFTTCCNSCDHSSKSCKKCISGAGKPSKNCDHCCVNCHKSKEECAKNAQVCCGNCNICVTCNTKFATAQMDVLTKKTVSLLPPPCSLFLFLHCLEISLNWRNLFGHTTVTDLQNFIDGKTNLKDFLMCKDTKQLFAYIKSGFLEIMNYTSNDKIVKNPLGDEEYKEFEESFDCILQFGKPLQRYLADNYNKIKKTFGDSADLQSKLCQIEEKIIDQFEILHVKIDDLNEKVDDIKKPTLKDSKISLTFSINSKKHSWIRRLFSRKQRFRQTELGVGGIVRTVLYDSCLAVMKESLQLQFNKDYRIKKVECDFQSKHKKPTRSRITFEMKISTERIDLSNDMMEHAEILCQELKYKIEDGVRSKYSPKTTVVIYSWEFGSIIIKGEVTLNTGDFTPTQQNDILALIKKEVTNSVGHEDVILNALPTTEVDYSIVRFSMDIVSESPDVIKKIQGDVQLVEVLLLEKMKIVAMKAEKESDWQQQFLEGPFLNFGFVAQSSVGVDDQTFGDAYRLLEERKFDTFFNLVERDHQTLNLRGKSNQTLFLRACDLNDSRTADFLLTNFREHLNLLEVDSNGFNAFHLVSKRGNVDLMRHLLMVNNSGLNVAGNGNMGTPLHWAAFCDKEDMVEFLLSEGADVNWTDRNGITADRLTTSSLIRSKIASRRMRNFFGFT